MTTASPEVRSKLLGEAFVGPDVFMLNRAGLVPIDLTPLSEDEWRAKMRPMA
jgi:hypothetical protein